MNKIGKMETPASASTVHLPPGQWQTVLDCLCDRFPGIARDAWQERIRRGRVLDAQGVAIELDRSYRNGMCVHYFREVTQEVDLRVSENVLHVDADLVIADKPHFLPVMPAGRYVRETLLARLMARLDNPNLVPLHRIDRATAGLVMFSVNPVTRGRYQSLFRERRIVKCYEALAPALPDVTLPAVRRSRLVAGEPFFRMREIEEGAANTETRIDVLERSGAVWRYALCPVTGRKHQLRVHMAALGAPILNDGFYPELADEGADDMQNPLKLLARSLAFVDPLTGAGRRFESGLEL